MSSELSQIQQMLATLVGTVSQMANSQQQLVGGLQQAAQSIQQLAASQQQIMGDVQQLRTRVIQTEEALRILQGVAAPRPGPPQPPAVIPQQERTPLTDEQRRDRQTFSAVKQLQTDQILSGTILEYETPSSLVYEITPEFRDLVSEAYTWAGIPPQRAQFIRHSDPVILFAELMFATSRREEYNRLLQTPDFDPRFFTFSAILSQDGLPVPEYVKGWTPNLFTKRRMVYTTWLVTQYNEKTIADNRSKHPEQFIMFNDPNYGRQLIDASIRGRRADPALLNKFSRFTSQPISQFIVEVPAPRTLSRTEFNLTIGDQTKTFKRLLGKLHHTLAGQPNPQMSPAPTSILTARDWTSFEANHYGGLITRRVYQIITPPRNLQEYSNIVRNALIAFVQENPQHPLAYYDVYAVYTSIDPSGRLRWQDRIPIARGFYPFQEFYQITPTLQEQVRQTYGSDAYHNDPNTLDVTRFIIERVDPKRYGSGGKNKDFPLNWCQYRNYESSNHGCFYKILREHLKTYAQPGTKIPRYDELWKALDPINYGKPTTFEQAAQAAGRYGIYLIIYDREENQLFNNLPSDRVTPEQNILRMIYHGDHYTHILRIIPTHERDEEISLSVFETGESVVVPIFIQIKTQVLDDAERTHFPTELTYLMGSDTEPTTLTDTVHASEGPGGRKKWKVIDDFIYALKVFHRSNLREKGTRVHYKIIACGGSELDFRILFLYLITNKFQCLIPPSPNGLLRSMLFWLKGNLFLSVWDPTLFGLPWITNADPKAAVRELSSMVWAYIKDIESVYGQTPLRYTSQQQMMYRVWKKRDVYSPEELSLIRQKSKEPKGPLQVTLKQELPAVPDKVYVPKASTIELDDIIRSSIAGPRMEAQVGYYRGDFTLVDVRSMYAYLMLSQSFPIGEEIVVMNPQEAIQYMAHPDYIGIYLVMHNQSSMKGRFPLAYHRVALYNPDGSIREYTTDLNKIPNEFIIEYLPDVTIKGLQAAGADIQLASKEGQPYAIVWRRSAPGQVFKNTLSIPLQHKLFWDTLKSSHDPRYDPRVHASRKNEMNGLSGKMVQKRSTFHWRLWNMKHKELADYLSTLGESSLKPLIYTVAENVVFTGEPKDLQSQYRGAPPSQLGVFIYAYGRDWMWQNILSKMPVYYVNTDGAVIDSSNLHLLQGVIGPNPGQLKVEAQFDEIFVARKSLFQGRMKHEVVKTSMSGISQSDLFDGRSIRGNEKLFFDLLYNNKRVVVTSRHLQNNMREGQLLDKVYDKTIIWGAEEPLREGRSRPSLFDLPSEPVPDGLILFSSDDSTLDEDPVI
jgi:hypothetical protein